MLSKRGTADLIFIAEIGINHNGDIDIALDLIKYAVACGCDIVKFQKRTPDVCVPEHQKPIMKYDTPWGDVTYLEYRYKVEFEKKEYDIIDKYCKELGVQWTASAWDVEAFNFLKQYDLKYHKIGSPMLTNLELLKSVALDNKHTFISTGMSTMKEIERAVNIFRDNSCLFELMHCVGCYPIQYEDANLKMIETLRKKFNCRVGYSGHEDGLQITFAAVALGASSVERHITLNRAMWGTDQAASVGKTGLQHLVRDCRIVKEALGNGIKKLLKCEEQKRKTLEVYYVN